MIRRQYEIKQADGNPGGVSRRWLPLSKGTMWLLILMGAGFLAANVLEFQLNYPILVTMGLTPAMFWHNGYYWQPLTAFLFDLCVSQLFFAVLLVYMTAYSIEKGFGTKSVWLMYWGGNLIGNILYVLLGFSSEKVVLGYGGGLCMLLGAYIFLEDRKMISLFGIIPMQARLLGYIMLLIVFFGSYRRFGSLLAAVSFTVPAGLIYGYLTWRNNVAMGIRR